MMSKSSISLEQYNKARKTFVEFESAENVRTLNVVKFEFELRHIHITFIMPCETQHACTCRHGQRNSAALL